MNERFQKEYMELISEIIKATYSKTKKDLNEIINGSKFKSILSNQFGFETSSFYFYDDNEDRLMFFHEALEDGINIPFYCVRKKMKNGSFESEIVKDEEFELRRDKQKKLLEEGGERLTATICYNNIISKTPRWSESEKKEGRIIIPEGEVMIFSYEYLLRNHLMGIGIKNKKNAEEKIVNSCVAQECWIQMHSDKNMKNREEESFVNVVKWLKEVLNNKNEYKYLWEAKDLNRNWFIKSSNKIEYLLEKHKNEKLNYDVLKEFSSLIIKYSFPESDKANIDLKAAKFHKRSRLSPPMELLHGTHNIVVFIIKQYLPKELIRAEIPINAFLFGTFYDLEKCLEYNYEIKDIYSLIATQDIIKFSMKKVEEILRKFRNTEEYMSKLSKYIFDHAFKSPFIAMKNEIQLIEEKDIINQDYNRIAERLKIIRNQIKKALSIFDVADGFSGIAYKSKKISVPLVKYLKVILIQLKEEIPIPESIKIVKDFPSHEININLLNKNSLKIIIENLIRNSKEAINKKNGKIEIKLIDDSKEVCLSIIDNGGGIDTKILPVIFAPFKSSKQNGDEKGLGLYICKNLVELEGGTIRAKNLKGGRASFVIVFNKV